MSSTLTQRTPWIQELSDAAFSERSALLEALIAAEFRIALLMQGSDQLPMDESYFELGMTSLSATEVRQRLEDVLGYRIDSVVLFNNPTVNHLLAYLRDDVLREFFETRPAEDGRSAAAKPKTERSPSARLLNDLLNDIYEA